MVKFKRFMKNLFGNSKWDISFNICNYLFFLVVAIIMLYPFWYVLETSFEVTKIVNGVPTLAVGLKAYATIFKNDGLVNAFLLSVYVVIVHVILHLVAVFTASYPLSRKHFIGRKELLLFLIITMLFSGGLIPFYVLITDLGMRNDVSVYIIPGVYSAFDIIICKNYLQSIPENLEEAARIDGANDIDVLLRIYLPLSGPILATIALWAGVNKWNNYMTGLLYIDNRDLWVIQNFLRNILITTSSASGGVVDTEVLNMSESVKMAAIVISMIPIIIVYPFVQKHFVKGMILGSIKG